MRPFLDGLLRRKRELDDHSLFAFPNVKSQKLFLAQPALRFHAVPTELRQRSFIKAANRITGNRTARHDINDAALGLENTIAESSISWSPGISGRSAMPVTNLSAANVIVAVSRAITHRTGILPDRRMPAIYITAGIGNRRKLTVPTAQDDGLAESRTDTARPHGHRL